MINDATIVQLRKLLEAVEAAEEMPEDHLGRNPAIGRALIDFAECARSALPALLEDIERLESALHKIAYEPIGQVDAADIEVLYHIGLIARAALETRAEPEA